MEFGSASRPWYKKRKYQFLMLVLAALLLLSFLPYLYHAPVTASQTRLNKSVDYFAHIYNLTTGLIPEYPGSHTFWLYSDNYLAALALSRYDPRNGPTSNFASALETAMGGYRATLSPLLQRNQYTALNSTSTSFNCSMNYALSWAAANGSDPKGSTAMLKTTANDQGNICSSQNYADLLFLQAVYYHRLKNDSAAQHFYQRGASDFDGVGIKDIPFMTMGSGSFNSYQTYKLALYLYAGACLGTQTNDSNYPKLLSILLMQQDNLTGGFYSGYYFGGLRSAYYLLTFPSTPHPNTETTALAALALEQLIRPSSSC
ncbi:MAG: hypothetical protein OK452_08775 [Thaumarchaeota archaeon]|nr:hypothetical protein [Nitrososphaerota archaeon]